MVIADQQAFNRKNLSLRGRATELNCSTKHHCAIRRLPEFKFWYSATKATTIAFVCTFFELFNIPVFWPILVMYFITLFCITMKRQIKVTCRLSLFSFYQFFLAHDQIQIYSVHIWEAKVSGNIFNGGWNSCSCLNLFWWRLILMLTSFARMSLWTTISCSLKREDPTLFGLHCNSQLISHVVPGIMNCPC